MLWQLGTEVIYLLANFIGFTTLTYFYFNERGEQSRKDHPHGMGQDAKRLENV